MLESREGRIISRAVLEKQLYYLPFNIEYRRNLNFINFTEED